MEADLEDELIPEIGAIQVCGLSLYKIKPV
jgi:hypothetical protein